MRAEISKNGQVTVVSLEGQISFETIPSFREHCMQKLKGEKVVFDLGHLNFVGSTGITAFFEIIKDCLELKLLEPKFCNVRSEFHKLFVAWFSDNVEIYEQQEQAIYAFMHPAAIMDGQAKKPIRVPNFRMTQEGWSEPTPIDTAIIDLDEE